MKTSVSNIAWGGSRDPEIVRLLRDLGVDGVELAPTLVWPSAPQASRAEVQAEALAWRAAGLQIAAIQSLLFGHPELQLFDARTSHDLLRHLSAMIELAGALGATVAVFGSPKNRVRGLLSLPDAHERAAEFFVSLLPVLEREGVILALEPNAPQYGADYLVEYADCVSLAEIVDSPWVAPQIDTGCLTMVGADIIGDIGLRVPAHFHMSAPELAAPPAGVDHAAIAQKLRATGYPGWVTLEMRQLPDSDAGGLAASIALLVSSYGSAA